MKNPRKEFLFTFVRQYYPDVASVELDRHLRDITGNKRKINDTLFILGTCPWVFLNYYKRRRDVEDGRVGIFQKYLSIWFERIELSYFNL